MKHIQQLSMPSGAHRQFVGSPQGCCAGRPGHILHLCSKTFSLGII